MKKLLHEIDQNFLYGFRGIGRNLKNWTKRFYFEFSIENSWRIHEGKVISFLCFYLKHYPPREGQEMKFNRDYIGIFIRKHFKNFIKIRII